MNKINQKGFAIIVVIAVVILLGLTGYFALVKQASAPSQSQNQPTPANEENVSLPSPAETLPPANDKEIPSSPTKLSGSGSAAEPVDLVLAEITVLAPAENGWKIQIDKIRDYIRYPKAPNPQLKAGDAVSVYFNGWLDTFKDSEKTCPEGYVKSPATPAGSANQSSAPQPEIIAGQKYLAKLYGCFAEIGGFVCPNQKTGWSGWLYNPSPVTIEYECVKPESGTVPPATNAQR